jgi:hypothetical protein
MERLYRGFEIIKNHFHASNQQGQFRHSNSHFETSLRHFSNPRICYEL